MTANLKSANPVIVLSKSAAKHQRSGLRASNFVTSNAGLRKQLATATGEYHWISYEKQLTEALLQQVSWPTRPLGDAVLIHKMPSQMLPALASCFNRIAFSSDGGFLPLDELAEVLKAENKADLFIGGSVDEVSKTLTLWRGTLDSLTVPFSAFEKSGDGILPDFSDFSVIDFGQTIRLGDYEAASDAVLYEFDPKYRRRISRERKQSEKSLGASLYRLRKQRGLRREDFAPEIASKTIARIEQGKVKQIHKATLKILARKLRITEDELETY